MTEARRALGGGGILQVYPCMVPYPRAIGVRRWARWRARRFFDTYIATYIHSPKIALNHVEVKSKLRLRDEFFFPNLFISALHTNVFFGK